MSAPDPAETLDAVNMQAVAEAIGALPEHMHRAVRDVMVHPFSAPVQDARQITIGPGQVAQLLSYHAGRVRFLAVAYWPNGDAVNGDTIQLGDINQVTAFSGFEIASKVANTAGQEYEFRTVVPIYVVNTSTVANARINFRAEYSVD